MCLGQCGMIKSKLSMIIPYIAVFAFFTGVIYYQHTVINRLADRVSALSTDAGISAAKIANQNETIRLIETESKMIMKEIGVLQHTIVRNIEETNRKKLEYDSYRGRLHEASLHRPTLIERRANNAFSNVMQAIASETSGNRDN